MVLPDIPEILEVQRLADERRLLGLYMTGHPLERFLDSLKAFRTHCVAGLDQVHERADVVLGGLIAGGEVRKIRRSRSGLTRMARITFEDETGSIVCVLWPEEYAKNEVLVKQDTIVHLCGTLDRRRDPAELTVRRIIPLERSRRELSLGVIVRLTSVSNFMPLVEILSRVTRDQAGDLDLFLRLGASVLKASAFWKLPYSDRLFWELEGITGSGQVSLVGNSGHVPWRLPFD
jgi:DNA polymerase III subunit alpha